MKKWIITGLLLATLPAMGQHSRKGEMRKNTEHQMSSEQRATLKSKEMALMLDLSDSQLNQVQKTLEAHFEEGKTLRESRKDADESDDRFELRNARLDHQLALQEDLKRILSEEQYALWKKAQMRQHKKRERGRHHMRHAHKRSEHR